MQTICGKGPCLHLGLAVSLTIFCPPYLIGTIVGGRCPVNGDAIRSSGGAGKDRHIGWRVRWRSWECLCGDPWGAIECLRISCAHSIPIHAVRLKTQVRKAMIKGSEGPRESRILTLNRNRSGLIKSMLPVNRNTARCDGLNLYVWCLSLSRTRTQQEGKQGKRNAYLPRGPES